jgi:hypothetical protein
MNQPPPPDPCIAANSCPPGMWVNVTPSGMSTDFSYGPAGENYGVMDVVKDPVRPGDFYAFVCYQGVWKSTDYGLTWAKIDTGSVAMQMENGRPWTAAIDQNPTRNPASPPALFTVSGYGSLLGVYKSTDGGMTWTNYQVNNTQGTTSSDVYALDIDPANVNHLIAGFHDVGLSESLDGGMTWRTVPVPSNFGISVFPYFVRGSQSPSTTWVTQAQWNDNTNGMWRTTNSGSTWTQVQPQLEHGHGSSQIYQDGTGNIWASGNAAGNGVIFRSTDFGVTWTAANNNNVPQNNVFGTSKFIYATFPDAISGTNAQHLQKAPIGDGLNWVDWTPTQPNGMTNGAKRGAVSNDGMYNIIVTGNWDAGLWRYVEP